MKKPIQVSLAVFLSVVGIGIITWAQIRLHQQHTIVAVINQVNAANTQTRKLNNGRILTVHPGNPFFSIQVQANQLNKIPVVECPMPFQLAWLNFVQTLRRSGRPFAGLGSVIEFEVSTVRADSSGVKEALARLDTLDPQKAWMQVEVVALKYGVQIH